MASFIDLMANHVWSEADIVNRTEAMIASEFSRADVEIINRKATAAALGMYVLSEEEQAEIGRYAEVSRAAAAAGEAARADKACLAKVLQYEEALALLQQEPQAPQVMIADGAGGQCEVANPTCEQDSYLRSLAQALCDSADADTVELYALRNPVAPIDEEA